MNQIEIIVSNTDGNIIGRLDIGDAEINTVFSLTDIREPEKRKTSHSIPFTIPGTKRNNQIFTHIFQEGFEAFSYNPNFKLNAIIVVNGNEYFKGSLQLNTAIKNDSDAIVAYEITIYGYFIDFFKKIEGLDLNEAVDLSEYDHPYTIPTVSNSWNTYIWRNNAQIPFNLGQGYVYPLDWKGEVNINNYPFRSFKPAFYLKTIFDKIFTSNGFSYQSNFLNSKYFKSLIIPYSGEGLIKLSQETIDKCNTRVGYIDTGDIDIWSFTSQQDWSYLLPQTYFSFNDSNDTINKYFDKNNNYNENSSMMVVPKNGKYVINVRLPLKLRFTGEDTNGTVYDPIKLVGGNYHIEIQLFRLRGGVNTLLDSYDYEMTNPKYDTWTTPGYNSDLIYVDEEYTDFFKSGDQVYFRIKVISSGSNYSFKTLRKNLVGIAVSFKSIIDIVLCNVGPADKGDIRPIFSMTLADETIEEGDNITMNDLLPKIKAVDLIKDINKMFNLYWMPIGDGKFLIEPRNEFYVSGGLAKDWTYKLDENSDVTINPLYQLTANKFNFTYSEDEDYYNNDYQTNWEEVYGSKILEIKNDFIDETLDVSVKFSPSPLVSFTGTDRFGSAYIDDNKEYKSPKTRILFYGGLLSTTKWSVVSDISGTTTYSLNPKYPYAGHLDNPINPKWDLNWSICKDYYFNWNNLIDNNLFNMFWKSQIEEMTDKNGHLLTGTFILSDVDMIQFDLRDIIQFRQVYYRVNKLTHNPLTSIAEVELIKIRDYKPHELSTISSSTGTTGTTWGWGWTAISEKSYISASNGNNYPTKWNTPFVSPDINPTSIKSWEVYTGISDVISTSYWNKNVSSEIIPTRSYTSMVKSDINGNFYSKQSAVRVLGTNNYIAPTAMTVEVNGNGNRISNMAENIKVTGNNNVIESGVKNVMVVGDNQYINRSNVSYINGNILDESGVRKNVSLIQSTPSAKGIIKGGKNTSNACKVLRGGQDNV